MTFTSSPPRRRAVRQQSIAVFPPPRTMTRLADLARVLERDAAEPVDADVNIRRAFLAAGQIWQIAAARSSGADEDRVVILFEYFFQRRDVMLEMRVDAEVENVIDLFVEHRLRQAKRRDLADA